MLQEEEWRTERRGCRIGEEGGQNLRGQRNKESMENADYTLYCQIFHHEGGGWHYTIQYIAIGVRGNENREERGIGAFVSWLTQSDQSDFSIGGVYF